MAGVVSRIVEGKEEKQEKFKKISRRGKGNSVKGNTRTLKKKSFGESEKSLKEGYENS